jgi:hypothetical protein
LQYSIFESCRQLSSLMCEGGRTAKNTLKAAFPAAHLPSRIRRQPGDSAIGFKGQASRRDAAD